MKKFTLPIKVMFSDCDPAQIVFYPRYFQWFDIATQRMFNELDMEWSTFWPERGIAGLPLSMHQQPLGGQPVDMDWRHIMG